MSTTGDHRRTLRRWVKLAEGAGWTVTRHHATGGYVLQPPGADAGILVPNCPPGGDHALRNHRARLRRAGLDV